VKLVDASFLVDYARGDEDAVSYLAAHDGAVTGASASVLSELHRGLTITQDTTGAEVRSKYEWVTSVPFTDEAAAEATEIHVELRSSGEIINRGDIHIAGTARSAYRP
jgi:predicted nucleic acid-binding protein